MTRKYTLDTIDFKQLVHRIKGMQITSPWSSLSRTPPYVLDGDREAVKAFNSRAKFEHELDVTLLPEPFLGNPEAPVVLLSLNPGWSHEDAEWHAKPVFRDASLANLAHQESEYPFFLLDPSFFLPDSKLSAPGSAYWRKKLRTVIERTGVKACAKNVFVVEYFPYHSKKAGNLPIDWESQRYSFGLVKRAAQRGARIVALRREREWREAVPLLNSYDKFSVVSSPQSAAVSPNNCGAAVHDDIVRRVRSA